MTGRKNSSKYEKVTRCVNVKGKEECVKRTYYVKKRHPIVKVALAWLSEDDLWEQENWESAWEVMDERMRQELLDKVDAYGYTFKSYGLLEPDVRTAIYRRGKDWLIESLRGASKYEDEKYIDALIKSIENYDEIRKERK